MRRWLYVLAVDGEQSLCARRIDRSLHRRPRQAGALREQRQRESPRETQHIEHEFERRFRRGDVLFATDGMRAAGVCQVLLRLFYFPASHDTVRLRELAVRAGPDAEVVA